VFGLILLEFRKLLGYRSVRIAMTILFVLPWIWSLAPAVQQIYKLLLVSMWQMPALALLTVMQFIMPLLVGMTAAELLGAEVAAGTLSPMLLRPIERYKVLGAKFLVAMLYPFILLLVLMLSSLLAGARFGLEEFIGGTGFGEGGFAGAGVMSIGQAFLEIFRAYFIAGITLAPIAALALLFSVVYLNTAAAALATIATLNVMRLLVVFPAINDWLLTTYLEAYVATSENLLKALVILLLYAVGIVATGLFIFERKDL
jgi:ABC-2 type transport system permease protein